LKSSGRQTSKLALVLWAGTCLAANGSYAADGPAGNNVPQPAAHAPAASTHRTSTRPAAKKGGRGTTASHSTVHRSATAHLGTTHHTSKQTTAHASTYSARSTAKRTTAYSSQRKASTSRSRYAANRRPRALTSQQRLARLHLQPERVEEIQRALIREGYLQGDPNGQWDARTRDAMQRYQTMNGFPATGLPEAKSLMKLGLGSHPLPPELDHASVGSTSPTAEGNINSAPPSAPVSQALPPS